jgi:hypothetical protein
MQYVWREKINKYSYSYSYSYSYTLVVVSNRVERVGVYI